MPDYDNTFPTSNNNGFIFEGGTTFQQMLQKQAQRASFNWLVETPILPQNQWTYGGHEYDPVVWTGMGVPDIDHVIEWWMTNPTGKISLGVNGAWIPLKPEDMQSLKTYFIAAWGNVAKPNYYEPVPPRSVSEIEPT